MDQEFDYDVMVIGGGSGGMAAAKSCAKEGKRVALCDFVKPSPLGTKWGLGGTCVNVGCIPKKLMHYASLNGEYLKEVHLSGWEVPEKEVAHNWGRMIQNVNNHVKSLNWGYKVEMIQTEVKYFNKFASFVDAHKVKLTDAKGEEEFVTFNTAIVAPGGRPNNLDLPGFKEYAMTSDDLFWQKEAPGSTLIIGAGYIALECGGFLQSMGMQTTVLVRSRPLSQFDKDMTGRVAKHMENLGVRFVSGYDSSEGKIEKGEDGKLHVTYKTKDNGLVTEVYDSVLVAIGRGADVKGLNLEAVGVKCNKWNKIVTDAGNKTSVDNIYALGDVIEMSPELTPVAIQEGQLLAKRLSGKSTEVMNYETIATTIFTPLEYSKVGYSGEAAAKIWGEDKIEEYHTSFMPLEWNYNKMEREKALCYIKAVCTHENDMKVVGLHYVGPNAGEVMQGFGVAVLKGITIKDLQNCVGIHPTCAEVFTELKVTKREQPEVVKSSC